MFVGSKYHKFFHKSVLYTTLIKYPIVLLTKFREISHFNLTLLPLFLPKEQRQNLAENSLSEGQIQGLMTLSYWCC